MFVSTPGLSSRAEESDDGREEDIPRWRKHSPCQLASEAEWLVSHHAGNVAVLSKELPQGRHLDLPRPGGVREVGPGGQTEHPSHTSDTSDIELPVCLLDVESIIRLLTLKLVSWAGADRAL